MRRTSFTPGSAVAAVFFVFLKAQLRLNFVFSYTEQPTPTTAARACVRVGPPTDDRERARACAAPRAITLTG